MIRITFEFADYTEAGKAIALLSGGTVRGKAIALLSGGTVRAKTPAADSPNPPAKDAAAGQAAAAKRTPAPAPAASSPAPTPSPAAGSVTPEQLTKAIVAAVTRVGRNPVLDHLQNDYGVSKGAEITDPEIRAACLASVSAL